MEAGLLNDEDLLGGNVPRPGHGLGGSDDGAVPPRDFDGWVSDEEEEEVAKARRKRNRSDEARRRERAAEERDEKVIKMVLERLEAREGGGHVTEAELRELRPLQLRDRAKEAGVSAEELAELFEEEEGKDWRAVLAALRRLLEEARPEWRMISVATVALVANTVLSLAIPRFFGMILDTATQASADKTNLRTASADVVNATASGGAIDALMHDRGRVTAALVLVVILASLAECGENILFSIAGQRVVLRLRKRLFHHMMVQDVAFFDKTKSGELVNRLSADVMMLKSAVEHSWGMFLASMMSLVATLLYLFFVSWKLTLIMMVTPPAILVCGATYGAYLERVAKATQDVLAGATDSASESIAGMRTVRAFGTETSRLAAYVANVQRSYQLGVKVAVAGGVFEAIMGSLVSLAIGGILYYGAGLVVSGELTSGLLTSYLIYCATSAS
jgi:ABC-type bacteriocin/lantibiotic exporter with double-glycine peptidase domain